MSHPPSTPVKVPASAATYTPATLDPDLRSQINAILIRDGHINKLQEHLLHSLNANPSNWPSAVQSHALSLLRSGEVSTFPALIRRVLEDVRQETQAASEKAASDVNGAAATTNGKTKGVNGTAGAGGGSTDAGLAMPSPVVEEVLKVARQSLEAVVDIDDGAT